MGFTVTTKTVDVELGTTARVSVSRATGSIRWLGQEMLVDVLVSSEPAVMHGPDTART
jgi:hypothetical protein